MVESDKLARDEDAHRSAATEFVRRISVRDVEGLETLILFGSTARGGASGLKSDVDFLAILSDTAEKSDLEDALRDVAYDVMIDHGPVIEIHVLSRSTFEQRRDHPFVRQVMRDGEVYV